MTRYIRDLIELPQSTRSCDAYLKGSRILGVQRSQFAVGVVDERALKTTSAASGSITMTQACRAPAGATTASGTSRRANPTENSAGASQERTAASFDRTVISAYRLVVVTSAWPNHPRITVTSTPALSSARRWCDA